MSGERVQTSASSGHRLMTGPNVLTLSRLPLAGALWIDPWELRLLLGSMAIAALTDVLDGYVARRLRRRLPPEKAAANARRGAWLDPLCDKIFVASVVGIAFVVARPHPLLLVLILARDLLEAPIVLAYRVIPALRRLRYDFSAAPAGKATTVVQFAALASLLLGLEQVAVPLAFLAGALGLLAVAAYLRRALRAPRDQT